MSICIAAAALFGLGAFTVARRILLPRSFGRFAFAGGPCGAGGEEGASCGAGWGGGRGPRWGRFGGRGRGIGANFWLRAFFARLDTTPGQEREIRSALDELRERVRDTKSRVPDAREDLGRAVAAETFDDAAFESATTRAAGAADALKGAFETALKRIHAVLDDKQRRVLAETFAKGGFGRFVGFRGPYR